MAHARAHRSPNPTPQNISMEPSSSRRHQRNGSARGPPSLAPHHHERHPSNLSLRPKPSPHTPAAAADAGGFYFQRATMEDDAISTLMDIDDSPLSGAAFLDEEDGDG